MVIFILFNAYVIATSKRHSEQYKLDSFCTMNAEKRLHNKDKDLEEEMYGVEEGANLSDRSSEDVYPSGSDTSDTNSVETGNSNASVSCSYF